MKCSNCGYETDKNFCPMCGQKIEPVNTTQAVNNPYNQAENFQPVAPFQPMQNNIPSVQPQTPNANIPPVPPQMPSVLPNTNAQKRKNNKVLAIIVACFVTAIIITGVVINIVSSCTSKTSITNYYPDTLDNFFEEDMNGEIDYGDMLAVGDTANLKHYDLKLTGCEKSTATAASLDEIGETDLNKFYDIKLTFEITNKSKTSIYFDGYSLSVMPSDNLNFYCSQLSSYDNSASISEGATTTFTVNYAVPQNAESIVIQLDDYNLDDNGEFCQFETSIK